MKRKKMNILLLSILVASQFSIGITVLAEAEKAEFVETTTEEQLEEVEVVKESVVSENSQPIFEMDQATLNNHFEVSEEAVGSKNFMETRGEKNVVFNSSTVWYPVGSEQYGEKAINKYFKDATVVKSDGQTLKSNEYSILYAEEPTGLNTIKKVTSWEMLVMVVEHATYSGSGGKYVDYGVNYGSSIVFESSDGTGGAYTIQVDEKGTVLGITASEATGNNDDLINKNYVGEDYYSIDVLRRKDSSAGINDGTRVITSLTAKGDEKKSSVLNRWDGSDVREGDIVKTWSAKNSANKLYTSIGASTRKENLVDKNGYAYYEVTSKGFVPYKDPEVKPEDEPRLEVRQQIIYTDTLDEELDRVIEESFEEVPDFAEVIGFIEYPDRDKEGISHGKIKVREESQYEKGMWNEYTYEAPFQVLETPEEILEWEVFFAPIIVPIGTDPSGFDIEDHVERVFYKGEILKEDEYTAELLERPDFIYAGPVEYLVEITLDRDKTKKVKEQAVITGLYNNTILTRETTSATSPVLSSVSLLEDEDGNPFLKANAGTFTNTTNDYLTNLSHVSLYRESDENAYLDVVNKTNSTIFTTYRHFNQEFSKKEIKYGDVFSQGVTYYETGKSFNGKSTYAARDEKLKKEADGYEFAYYEITPDGYRLLNLNQLKVNNNILEFDAGSTESEVNSKADSALIIPPHIDNKGQFRCELSDVDTKKLGRNQGTLKVFEELATGGEFMTTYPVEYKINETLDVEMKPVTIPVGTASESINPQDYIKEVKLGDEVLAPSEYTVSIENNLKTQVVGEHPTKIKVTSTKDNKTKMEVGETIVTWNHSIATKSADGKMDVSISLLDNNGKPYLKANEGTGLSTNNLSTRPFVYAYRGNISTPLIGEKTESGYASVDALPKATMEKWNKVFAEKDFKYGDVFGYRVDKRTPSNTSEMGSNTWASRNEKLVKETEGYDRAYYEMTPNGYRLMQFNQLEVNPNLLAFPLGTKLDKMNEKANEAMIVPKHITNPENYRFEFASIDSATAGKKTTQMKVYEKLSTDDEFMSTREVAYIINPQVKENFYDESGQKLKSTKITNFEFGTEYQPKADNYVSFGEDVYMYKGWLKENEKPGKDKVREGQPAKTTQEATFHYIYEKADNHINMTIPTELIFGTEKNSSQITSKNYEIKNNSNKVSTEVVMSQFVKEKSEVTLLKQKDKDPSGTKKMARLNVLANQEVAINSLTEDTKDEKITILAPGENTSIGLTGQYFGPLNESVIVNYQMSFKFRATSSL